MKLIYLKELGKFIQKKKSRFNFTAINDKYSHAILDDGFQDSSIEKDLSIICFHGKQWIGNGRILPSGPLRESLKILRTPNVYLSMELEIKKEKIY